MLGSGPGDAEEIKKHAFFTDTDWDSVFRKELEPPKPELKLPVPEFINEQMLFASMAEQPQNKVDGWSFVKRE